MSSEIESTKSDDENIRFRNDDVDEDISCGLLLRDIEEISKALYLHKNPRSALNAMHDHNRNVAAKTSISESKSDVVIHESSHKDKRSSIWKWRPLKALAHIRNLRFNCCFFLHVHAIEGLPKNFNNLDMRVTWKRKANMLRTNPARVFSGMAEFEETLMHRCTVFVGRTGPQSDAKYEPKLFFLQTSVVGAPRLDIGSHCIDLSRLLPLTLEELEAGKSCTEKWTTSFNLSGKAKGATLNVSFGFSILNGNWIEPGGLNCFTDSDTSSGTSELQNLDTVRGVSTVASYQPSMSANSNLSKEILPKQGSEFSQSLTLLYQKYDELKMGTSMEFDLCHDYLEYLKAKSEPIPEYPGEKAGHDFNDTEFDVIEQGVEVSMKDQKKVEKSSSLRINGNCVIETIDVAEIFAGEEAAFDEYSYDERERATDDIEHRDNHTSMIKPAFEELDSEFYDLSTSKPAETNYLLDVITYKELGEYMKSRLSNKTQMLMDSLSLDDVTIAESIENDFLNMLGIDQSQNDLASGSGHDPPSDLLRRFEEDILACENPILDFDVMAEQKESSRVSPKAYSKVASEDDFDLSIGFQTVERNHSSVNHSFMNKRNAEVLENLETEALMNEWGLSEKAFQYSPHGGSGGFGSPIYTPEEEPLQLPSIEEDLGPIVRTKDGGLLRSMHPLLFRNVNNGARLIVQVSTPIVLPSAMGLTVMEMLQRWASVGVEKMGVQANELMPLEDITGKTIRQVIAEAKSDAFNRLTLERESEDGVESINDKKPVQLQIEQIDSDYVTLKDLVPMAITNIEALLVEGLKIQSGMSVQEPPSSIRIHLAGNSASLGNASELSSNFSSERASSSQFLDVDELIKYSLSLEEWMRLDSGEHYAENDNHEKNSKLFAGYCVKPVELDSEQLAREDETTKLVDRSCGVFSNNFTMGLKVQLRDPLRNHEMVGSSMLALIQIDRVFSRKQLEPCCLSSERVSEHITQGGDNLEQNKTKLFQPMFKVIEAHLAGLNVRCGNKPLWGSSRQQQSGSRWLLSSGMAKPNKNLVSNSNAVRQPSLGLRRKAPPEDVLWSISFPIQGEAATWNDQIALNVHVRNPDIIFPTESVK